MGEDAQAEPGFVNGGPVVDAWGEALLDYLEGVAVEGLLLEAEGGGVGPAMQPEWFYRREPDWEPEERQVLKLITDGPVLDLGAGAGRVSLHLQDRGLRVTAVESSPGAAEVCRRRGVGDVRLQDLIDPPSDQVWMTVLLLCGNLGLGGSWDGNRRLLSTLAQVCSPGALLVADSINYTGPAEVNLRIHYGNRVTAWWRQRNVAASEIHSLVQDTGWKVAHQVEAPNGVDHYVALTRT